MSNFDIETYNRENTKIETMEKENVKMLILYRSLYTLKHKFENHKGEIYQIYAGYNKSNKTVAPIPLEFFKEIMNQLMSRCSFCLIPYAQYMELLTPDLLAKANRHKASQVIALLERFIRQNLQKYNGVFHEKQMKEKQKRLEEEKRKNILGLTETEIAKAIVQYDKRANVISTSQQMIEKNKELKLSNPAYQYDEDDIDVLYDSKYLYREMLPIAFAEFLQSINQIALIDTNDELKEELKALFDNEIMLQLSLLSQKDPAEEMNMKLKNVLFEEMNVDKMLKYYQNALMIKQSKGASTLNIEKMINQLVEQKKHMAISKQKIQREYDMNNTLNSSNVNVTQSYHDATLYTAGNKNTNSNEYSNRINSSIINKSYLNVSKIVPKSMLSKDERRKNALTEIFYFYTRQHLLVGATPTFDNIKKNENHINLSEFSKFCVEFKIMIKKYNLVEMFKKTASDSRSCSFDEFCILIQKLAKGVNDEKKSYINDKIRFFETKIKEYDEIAKKDSNKANEDNVQKQQEGDNSNNKSELSNNNQDMSTIGPNAIDQNANQSNEELQTSNNQDQGNQSNITKDNMSQRDNETNKAGNKNTKGTKDKKKNKKKVPIKPQLSLFFNNVDDIKAQITTLRMDYQKLDNKPYQQLIEELVNYLELDNEKAYRQKMVGFYYAFNDRENPRIATPSTYLSKRQLSPTAAREMGDILIQRKKEKEEEKRLKQMKEKEILFEKTNKKIQRDIERLHNNASRKLESNQYKQIKLNSIDYSKVKNSKISWEELSKVDYDHFIIRKNDEKFKEVINENNIDSDDEDLLRHLNYDIKKQYSSNDSRKVASTDENNQDNRFKNDKGLKNYKANAAQYNIKDNNGVSYKQLQADKKKKIAKV